MKKIIFVFFFTILVVNLVNAQNSYSVDRYDFFGLNSVRDDTLEFRDQFNEYSNEDKPIASLMYFLEPHRPRLWDIRGGAFYSSREDDSYERSFFAELDWRPIKLEPSYESVFSLGFHFRIDGAQGVRYDHNFDYSVREKHTRTIKVCEEKKVCIYDNCCKKRGCHKKKCRKCTKHKSCNKCKRKCKKSCKRKRCCHRIGCKRKKCHKKGKCRLKNCCKRKTCRYKKCTKKHCCKKKYCKKSCKRKRCCHRKGCKKKKHSCCKKRGCKKRCRYRNCCKKRGCIKGKKCNKKHCCKRKKCLKHRCNKSCKKSCYRKICCRKKGCHKVKCSKSCKKCRCKCVKKHKCDYVCSKKHCCRRGGCKYKIIKKCHYKTVEEWKTVDYSSRRKVSYDSIGLEVGLSAAYKRPTWHVFGSLSYGIQWLDEESTLNYGYGFESEQTIHKLIGRVSFAKYFEGHWFNHWKTDLFAEVVLDDDYKITDISKNLYLRSDSEKELSRYGIEQTIDIWHHRKRYFAPFALTSFVYEEEGHNLDLSIGGGMRIFDGVELKGGYIFNIHYDDQRRNGWFVGIQVSVNDIFARISG